ncbi:MAG: DEAD/DEAH box helicase [Planctomycetes bacterium]|nr:DEAD/DEAH box helicase [Planctomycetota bacterium]
MEARADRIAASPLDPGAPLSVLGGIGPSTAARLAAVGLRCVQDLVAWLPRRYRALLELDAPDEAAVGALVRVRGEVSSCRSAWLPGRRSMVTVVFAAVGGGTFEVQFFNQPWLKKAYPPGQPRLVEGTLQLKGRRFLVQGARVLPVAAQPVGEVQLRYPEVEGISSLRLQQWIGQCLDRVDWTRVALPPLPPGLAAHDGSLQELLVAMHRPRNVAHHEHARRHFAVREAVELFTEVERARRARAQRPAAAFPVDPVLAQRILARIPLQLTGDQRAAVEALWQRLAGPAAMGVLLQGDVGTGKTAVAIAAALAVLARGGTVAFLAPTELLAEQHAAVVARWLQGSDVRVVLHTASQRDADLTAPGPLLVFGTHALFAGELALPRLRLVVVDEQHRFGVAQRMALVHKGDNPHVLVMTATPIPRTLALVLFGDLDSVSLRERPPGRRGVRAFQLPQEQWPRAVRSIQRAVRRGGRVFVICPAVGEDGEKGGVVRVHEALAAQFRCGLVHGRLKTEQRQAVLRAFRDGALDVLVGTTVLEVGVDVPAAVLVVVVAAHRFGIATLHQVRGRVGRGSRRGIALLCGPRTERVAAVCRTMDGFELAEADLAIRGSGELLGTAQSGFSDLRALDPVEDLDLLLEVRKAVQAVGGAR